VPGASGFIIIHDPDRRTGARRIFAPLGIDVSRVNRIATAMLTVQAPGAVSEEAPLLAGGPSSGAEVETGAAPTETRYRTFRRGDGTGRSRARVR
jgi:hypothetical protein